MKYKLSPTGVLLVTLLSIALFLFVVSGIVSAVTYRAYFNCKEMKADGVSNVKMGDKYYQAALDRDGDSIACE